MDSAGVGSVLAAHSLEGPFERELLARLGVAEAEVPELKQRAEAYLRGPHFQEASGSGLVTVLTGLAEAIEEDTGTVQKDGKSESPKTWMR